MKHVLLLTLIATCLCSCKSLENGKALTAGVATLASGATYAMNDSGDAAALAAGAGLATYLLGEYIRGEVIDGYDEEYQLGYRMGIADATKRQYELIQNQQRRPHSGRNNVRYFAIPIPREKDGKNYSDNSVYIRVTE